MASRTEVWCTERLPGSVSNTTSLALPSPGVWEWSEWGAGSVHRKVAWLVFPVPRSQPPPLVPVLVWGTGPFFPFRSTWKGPFFPLFFPCLLWGPGAPLLPVWRGRKSALPLSSCGGKKSSNCAGAIARDQRPQRVYPTSMRAFCHFLFF